MFLSYIFFLFIFQILLTSRIIAQSPSFSNHITSSFRRVRKTFPPFRKERKKTHTKNKQKFPRVPPRRRRDTRRKRASRVQLRIKLWQTSCDFHSTQVMEAFACMNIPAICESDAKVDVAVKNPVKLVQSHFTI